MAKTDPRLALLQKVDLFSGLNRKELESVLQAAREWTFKEGQEMAVQGEKGGRFYLLLEGEAHVQIDGTVLATLRPGDYFGEMALLDGLPRSATVRATAPVRTLGLAVFNFMPLVRKHPSIAEKLLSRLSCRVRELENKLADSSQRRYLDASVER